MVGASFRASPLSESDGDPSGTDQREWLSELYQLAHSDVRWAKEQGWRIASWTFALLAAILALYRDPFSHAPVCYFAIMVAAIVISAGCFLFDLDSFAREARTKSDSIETAMPERMKTILPKRDAYPNHASYLVVQLVSLLIAGAVTVLALNWIHVSTP